MDQQVSALVSALDAIAFTRIQDPAVLKKMARDALKGFDAAQQKLGTHPEAMTEQEFKDRLASLEASQLEEQIGIYE